MRRAGLKALAFSLTVISSMSATSQAIGAEDGKPVKTGWDGSGVSSQSWNQQPGTGIWSTVPFGVADDPNQYKFEFLCLVSGSSFDKSCLAATVQCAAAEGGHPVDWYVAPKGLKSPVWSFFSGPTCIYSEKPRDVMAEIAARIQQDFRNSRVAPASVTSQPGPNTLRGAETNFFAVAHQQSFDVQLLGQHVHITATPVEYTWSYGDGGSLGPTPFAGAPLPQDRWGEQTATSHVYARTGDFSVIAATQFRGTYSVNGGPPLPVPGEGTFASAPFRISVWRAETKTYADDCNQNPRGEGCPGVPVKP